MKLLLQFFPSNLAAHLRTGYQSAMEVPKRKMGFALRFFLYLNLTVGQSFPKKIFNIKPWTFKNALCLAAVLFNNLLMAVYAYQTTWNFYVSFQQAPNLNMSSLAFLFAGLFGILLALWRFSVDAVKSGQVAGLFKMLLKSHLVSAHMVSRSTRKCLIILGISLAIYFSFIVFGLNFSLRMRSLIFDSDSDGEYKFNATKNKSWQHFETFSFYKQVMKNISYAEFTAMMVGSYSIVMITLIRFLVSDVCNHFFYFMALELFTNLEKSIPCAINSKKIKKVDDWMQNHHECTRYLNKVNSTTAPNVIATVIFNTLEVCIADYIVALQLLDTGHSAAMFLFGVLALLQIFIYCYFGQKIRALTLKIHTAAYQAQWAHGPKNIQSAVVMIANATSNPHNISQIGAPFFSLSIDFFTSIVSAVVTYFLVLMQFK